MATALTTTRDRGSNSGDHRNDCYGRPEEDGSRLHALDCQVAPGWPGSTGQVRATHPDPGAPTYTPRTQREGDRRMAEPNRRLRAARERCLSPVTPGQGMSRSELAEAVNAWLWETTRRRYDLDGHHIAK